MSKHARPEAFGILREFRGLNDPNSEKGGKVCITDLKPEEIGLTLAEEFARKLESDPKSFGPLESKVREYLNTDNFEGLALILDQMFQNTAERKAREVLEDFGFLSDLDTEDQQAYIRNFADLQRSRGFWR